VKTGRKTTAAEKAARWSYGGQKVVCRGDVTLEQETTNTQICKREKPRVRTGDCIKNASWRINYPPKERNKQRGGGSYF